MSTSDPNVLIASNVPEMDAQGVRPKTQNNEPSGGLFSLVSPWCWWQEPFSGSGAGSLRIS